MNSQNEFFAKTCFFQQDNQILKDCISGTGNTFTRPGSGIILPGLQMCMHYNRRSRREGDIKQR